MMGRQRRDQGKLFYAFRLEDRIPEDHLLRRMNVFVAVAPGNLHEDLAPYYSDIGRPSVDPELMIRMLIVGYCYGIRSERRLVQEVDLHLGVRWFCKLDLDDEIPHHSTFSTNRLGHFRESDLLRHLFERIVWSAMAIGLVKGEGFAVDASVVEANACRYHGKAPAELDWTEKQRQKRAVGEHLAALDAAAEPNPDRKPPKVISPSVTSISIYMRLTLLASGQYLTMLPISMLRHPADKAWLRALAVRFDDTPGSVAAITLKQRRLSGAAKLFLQSCRDVAAAL